MDNNVTYGNHSIFLNLDLVEDKSRIPELKELYIQMFKNFEKQKTVKNNILLYNLNQEIETIEFKMQEIFGFNKDKNFHRYWNESPRCTCPKLDNIDLYGTEYRIFDTECPIHGSHMKNILKRKDKIKRILNIDL